MMNNVRIAKELKKFVRFYINNHDHEPVVINARLNYERDRLRFAGWLAAKQDAKEQSK